MSRDETAEMGMNKTGIGTAPRLSKEMIESSNDALIPGNGAPTPESERMEYIQQKAKIGSVPPPASIKGAAKSAMQALQGKKATVLIDKLAERLAFERSGVRLYEALMLKCRASDDAGGDGTLAKLEEICRDELSHFHMVWECIEKLGGDPTVLTPSANTAAVASMGIPKVLTDPRTTLPQCLEAILTAELVDCDAWERLTELAEGFNQKEMVEKFNAAVAREKDHRVFIRDLLERELKSEAGVSASA